MSNNQQSSSKFNTLKEWPIYEDVYNQFRVSITNVDKTDYIVIAKFSKITQWIKPNPYGKAEKVVSFNPTRKQIFLRREVFEAILEKGAEILKVLEEIEAVRSISMFTMHNASLNNTCIISNYTMYY